MNDFKFLLTGYDTRYDGIVVYLFVQIVRITSGKLNTPEIIGILIIEISLYMITQIII